MLQHRNTPKKENRNIRKNEFYAQKKVEVYEKGEKRNKNVIVHL